MKNLFKKSCAAALCGAMVLTAAGCGNTTATALTIDGMDIRAGIYIYYQMDALNEAATLLSEEQPELDMYAEGFDITDYSVEGTPVKDWIKNKTVELCKKHVAVNKLFDEYGLSLTAEETAEIKSYVSGLWTEENVYAQYIYGVDIIGEYYESLGIGEQSYKDITTTNYKQEAVFEHIYGDGGTQAVPVDELDMKVATTYAQVKSFEIDPEVNTPQTYLDMLNGGMSFAEVEQAYNKDEAVAGIEADMADAAANGEEYTGTLPEEIEVPLSDEADLLSIVGVDENYPSADYVSAVFEMANGESKIITSTVTSSSPTAGEASTSASYYLVTRMDITADEAVMEEYRSTTLHNMKDEEFEATLKTSADGYSVSENAAAIKKYTVENLNKRTAE